MNIRPLQLNQQLIQTQVRRFTRRPYLFGGPP